VSGLYVDAEKSTFSVRHIEGPVQDVLKRLLRKSLEKLTILNVQTRFGVVIPYIFL